MKLHPSKNEHFSWQEGNRFELLVDGENFFPAMLKAIKGARHYVLLEMYLFESGKVANQFIETMAEASQRGVQIYLLLDHFGALGLDRNDRQQFRRAGINLTFYNPLQYGELRRNLLRDHRKLLVVDGETAFVGGAGITDDFAPVQGGKSPTQGGKSPVPVNMYWHEVIVSIRGPNVLQWQRLFQQVWSHWASPPLKLPETIRQPLPGGRPGRVVTSSGPSRMEIKRSLLKHIRNAEHRIWIATAYFMPSWKIRRALGQAARRGIDVRLLLPGPHTDHPIVRHAGRRFFSSLLHSSVRIYEYQPRFLHAKINMCDNWVSIGSSNIDRWNLRWNLEANQEIDDQIFAGEVKELFVKDFAQSQEYHAQTWRKRSRWLRWLEWLLGFVDRWLERHTRRHHKD